LRSDRHQRSTGARAFDFSVMEHLKLTADGRAVPTSDRRPWRGRMTRPDSDSAIAECIFSLLGQRRADATICPSEVARALHPSASQWRAAMPRIREVAGRLASRGLLRVTRKGIDVEATSEGGPIRLGRPA